MAEKDNLLGLNYLHTKRQNRALVFKMICTRKQISRIDISRLTGLSKMAITNIVNDLIRDKMVVEAGEASDIEKPSSGRRPVYLSADTSVNHVIGLYISRDYAIATLSNLKCEIQFEERTDFIFEESGDSFTEKIVHLVRDILNNKKTGNKKILGIGISCIGPLDSKNGIILEPPNFHKLKSIPLKQILIEKFRLDVVIDNDMNTSSLAEKLYGNATDLANFIYVGVTNGIGAGIVTNHELYEGDMGFGGEIGHITVNFEGPRCACGNVGCLELYASIPEIVSQAKNSIALGMASSLKEDDVITWERIAAHAKKWDGLSINLIDRLCFYISIGLTSLVNILDPQKIFLGHDITLAGGYVAEKVQEYINQHIISAKYKKIPVEISFFNDRAPIAGSAALIIDNLLFR